MVDSASSGPAPDPRPVVFGEVLFDCFPDGSRVLGGAPFNVAWHLQAFGLSPLFVSRVGDDAPGAAIREAMIGWGMDLSGLQSDANHPTGTVQVSIRDNEPSFDIVADRAYDHIAADEIPSLEKPSVLYHGTLALRSPVSSAALAALRRRIDAPVFVDVNLRPPWWYPERLPEILDRATWVKINHHELAALVPEESQASRRAEALRQRFGLDLLLVTRGSEGATAYLPSGETASVIPTAGARVVDTVGAGDAFASVLLQGLIRAWPLAVTLQRAQAFASAIVGVRGAVSTDRGFYQPFAEAWGT